MYCNLFNSSLCIKIQLLYKLFLQTNAFEHIVPFHAKMPSTLQDSHFKCHLSKHLNSMLSRVIKHWQYARYLYAKKAKVKI